MCVKKMCPHDHFPCAGFLCLPKDDADAGQHLVCLSYLIQLAMNVALKKDRFPEYYKEAYKTMIGGDKMKKLAPLKHPVLPDPAVKNDVLHQVFNNAIDYSTPSIEEIANRLINLYEEDGNGSYFNMANGLDMEGENGQTENTAGDVVVMTHVATTVAQAALGFIKDAHKIFDQDVTLLDKREKGEDVQEWVELIADNPLGLKFCKDSPILIP